jgi:peptidoglycan/LPS O-acetylase OafA/YrhL
VLEVWHWLVLCIAAGVFVQLEPALRAVAAVFLLLVFCFLLMFASCL